MLCGADRWCRVGWLLSVVISGNSDYSLWTTLSKLSIAICYYVNIKKSISPALNSITLNGQMHMSLQPNSTAAVSVICFSHSHKKCTNRRNQQLVWNENTLTLRTFGKCLIITATRNQSPHTFLWSPNEPLTFWALCKTLAESWGSHWEEKQDSVAIPWGTNKQNRRFQGNLIQLRFTCR